MQNETHRVLDLRVAIVTGAGRGIGAAIAETLAVHGARVVMAARTEHELQAVQARIRDQGGEAIAHPTNVCNEEEVRELVRTTLETYKRVDILVNCAGILGPTGPFHQSTAGDWDQLMATNLRGTYLMCKYVAAPMIEKGKGTIVNISSILGKRGAANVAPYCTSKFALIGFTESIALELAASGIGVNCVCPGYVDTKLANEGIHRRGALLGVSEKEARNAREARSPLGRLTRAEEVAGVVLFLCSDDGGVMIGESLNASLGAR